MPKGLFDEYGMKQCTCNHTISCHPKDGRCEACDCEGYVYLSPRAYDRMMRRLGVSTDALDYATARANTDDEWEEVLYGSSAADEDYD